MHLALLVAASWGVVLLWHRALPLKPIKDRSVVRLHRIHEWIMNLGDDRPTYDITDHFQAIFQRCIAYPFWFLKNVLNCGECLCPYIAFGLGLGCGHGIALSCLLALSAYAGWIHLFVTRENHA